MWVSNESSKETTKKYSWSSWVSYESSKEMKLLRNTASAVMCVQVLRESAFIAAFKSCESAFYGLLIFASIVWRFTVSYFSFVIALRKENWIFCSFCRWVSHAPRRRQRRRWMLKIILLRRALLKWKVWIEKEGHAHTKRRKWIEEEEKLKLLVTHQPTCTRRSCFCCGLRG